MTSSDILQKIDSLKCPDIRELEGKIEKNLEEEVEKIVGNNITKDLNYLVEELSLKTLEVNEGKRRIKELETIINNKDDIIEHLNNTCVEIKIKLENLEISEEQQSYSRAHITRTLRPNLTQNLCSENTQAEEKEPIEILDTLDLENKHENALEDNNTHQGTFERILEELNSLKYER